MRVRELKKIITLIKGINDKVLVAKSYCSHVGWLMVAYMIGKGT